MADPATVFSIATNLLQLLQSPVLHGMTTWKSDLQSFEDTLWPIQDMLLDYDRQPALSGVQKLWLETIQDLLYHADDLLDEVVTRAAQKLHNKVLFKEVTRVLQNMEEVIKAFRNRSGIDDWVSRIRQDDMVYYHHRLRENIVGRGDDVKAILDMLQNSKVADNVLFEFPSGSVIQYGSLGHTCYYHFQLQENIVGRGDDVNAILDMLQDSNVAVVVVVGIGGVGKTSLAKLVFDHEAIESEFEGRTIWVTVGDQGGERFDKHLILCTILQSITRDMPTRASSMEYLLLKLREQLEKSKYFIVFDDVWTEDSVLLMDLKNILMMCARGSKILITTRSELTADVVLGRRDHPNKYMLQGLSDNHAWLLLESTAFGRPECVQDLDLVETSKKIIKKCCNVPFAIEVAGSILSSLPPSKWKLFEEGSLSEAELYKEEVVTIFKPSYDNLPLSLKSCSSYCALFPLDFEFKKDNLIYMWIAQGFIQPSYGGQSIIDAAEENFHTLLKRGFFQDCNSGKSVYDKQVEDYPSFKIHGIFRDFAQKVVGDSIGLVSSTQNNLGEKVRHLFIDRVKCSESWFSRRKIRSCIIEGKLHSNMVTLIANNWTCLRTLRLCLGVCESLPNSIGELLHLRYLDLSDSRRLKVLPATITNLYNLQTLILRNCFNMKEWPLEFGKLINLIKMDLFCCGFTCMPPGIEKLTILQVLTDFWVADEDSNGKSAAEQMKGLKALTNLSGRVQIRLCGALNSLNEGWEGSCFEDAAKLEEIVISFTLSGGENCKPLMEKLLPHPNLKRLRIYEYNGDEIPRWGRLHDDWALLLPNLIHLKVDGCKRLRHLPSLSKLMHLKSLSFMYLSNLEYMEDSSNISSTSRGVCVSFFPSLEELIIVQASKMKGWWKPIMSAGENRQPPFPRLSLLKIDGCSSLTSFPPCPRLVSIRLTDSNSELQIRSLVEDPSSRLLPFLLEKITVSSVLHFSDEIEELFMSCSSSLRSLVLLGCPELRSLSGRGLEHLTALESLIISDCPKLRFGEEGGDNEMPWRAVNHKLHTLELYDLVSIEFLPSGVKYLTSLQTLTIKGCSNLKALPEWISCLSSLRSLKISNCVTFKSLPEGVQHLSSLESLEINNCPNLTDTCLSRVQQGLAQKSTYP